MWDIILEIFGFVSALLYLYLEVKQRWSMWIVGIISSLVFVYVFAHAKLYAEAGLNTYYALAGFYGMWCWRNRGPEQKTLRVTRITPRLAIILAAITLALWAAMRYVLAHHTDSPVPAADAFVAALSITGTYMLAKKILEQWHVWIVANAAATALFFHKDLHVTGALYVIYTIISFYGLWRWRRDMKMAG
jgi:nicotinamide mononucleotide transporter